MCLSGNLTLVRVHPPPPKKWEEPSLVTPKGLAVAKLHWAPLRYWLQESEGKREKVLDWRRKGQ